MLTVIRGELWRMQTKGRKKKRSVLGLKTGQAGAQQCCARTRRWKTSGIGRSGIWGEWEWGEREWAG
jgi:hypothetical protein